MQWRILECEDSERAIKQYYNFQMSSAELYAGQVRDIDLQSVSVTECFAFGMVWGRYLPIIMFSLFIWCFFKSFTHEASIIAALIISFYAFSGDSMNNICLDHLIFNWCT